MKIGVFVQLIFKAHEIIQDCIAFYRPIFALITQVQRNSIMFCKWDIYIVSCICIQIVKPLTAKANDICGPWIQLFERIAS